MTHVDNDSTHRTNIAHFMSTFDEFPFNTESELLISAMTLRAINALFIASVTISHQASGVCLNTPLRHALRQPSGRPIKYLWVEDPIQ